MAGLILVAGGHDATSTKVYDVVLNKWLQLPCALPSDGCLWAWIPRFCGGIEPARVFGQQGGEATGVTQD